MGGMNPEFTRRHPRIPVNLVCIDEADTRYLVFDISRGGMGLVLSAGADLPQGVEKGTLLNASVVVYDKAEISIAGHIAWARERAPNQRAALGVQFHLRHDGQRMAVLGMTHLLRPDKLSLRFYVGQTFDPRASDEFVVLRAPLFDVPLIAMKLALFNFSRFLGIELKAKHIHRQTNQFAPNSVSVHVGFNGALSGEIWLRTSQAFATRLSRVYLSEDTQRIELIKDSLTELLSTIAGQMGDELEIHGYAIDVVPPNPEVTHLEPRHGMQSVSYLLEGAGEPIEFTVITASLMAAT
jgi:CheY-specific phosphatase CheX